METLEDKAAIYLEEIGISGDTMVQCDMSEHKGWMNLHDIMAGFVSEQLHNNAIHADGKKQPISSSEYQKGYNAHRRAHTGTGRR